MSRRVGGPKGEGEGAAAPSVSVVFLVYNRRSELRESLERMVGGCGCDPDRLEFIVVDNASTDGSAEMVARDYPQVHLIARQENVGVSGWNDGFAVARGEYVLALDDDCYLDADALRRAVEAARNAAADLVSFTVVSSYDREHRYSKVYPTGLLSFWGCAVLIRRAVLGAIGGFDPRIFIWAHELEFMVRFFDHGFRHLHLPEVVAVHIKEVGKTGRLNYLASPGYRYNGRHFAYIAGKLLRPRDALEVFIARVAVHLREGIRENPAALRALPDCFAGFFQGLRHRRPVRNPEVSRTYRLHFHSFASPWWFSRPLSHMLRGDYSRYPDGRVEKYFAERSRYYPEVTATLEF